MSDLRRHPRIPTDLRVEVTNSADQKADALISNISPGGVMIDGDLAFKDLVCQGRDNDPMSQAVEVSIRCSFPGESIPFRCRCRLIYVRRLAQDKFNLGFRFIKMRAAEAERLERYVMRDFTPASPLGKLDNRAAGSD